MGPQTWIHWYRYPDTGPQTQVHRHRYTDTGTKRQVHWYRDTDTGTLTQLHKHRYTDTGAQTQVHRHRYTDTGTPTQVHRHSYTEAVTDIGLRYCGGFGKIQVNEAISFRKCFIFFWNFYVVLLVIIFINILSNLIFGVIWKLTLYKYILIWFLIFVFRGTLDNSRKPFCWHKILRYWRKRVSVEWSRFGQ